MPATKPLIHQATSIHENCELTTCQINRPQRTPMMQLGNQRQLCIELANQIYSNGGIIKQSDNKYVIIIRQQ